MLVSMNRVIGLLKYSCMRFSFLPQIKKCPEFAWLSFLNTLANLKLERDKIYNQK